MIDKPDLPDIANDLMAITDVEHIDSLDLDEAGKSEPEPDAPSPLNPLLSLGSLECKWPIGDPRSSEFRFCRDPRFTAKAKNGLKLLPYCEHHVRVSRGISREDPSL
jgi:hypothetical protein